MNPDHDSQTLCGLTLFVQALSVCTVDRASDPGYLGPGRSGPRCEECWDMLTIYELGSTDLGDEGEDTVLYRFIPRTYNRTLVP